MLKINPKFNARTGHVFVVACLALAWAWPSTAAADFNLNFATNPTLPSAQGLSYYGGPTEASVFTIVTNSTLNTTVLHLDTSSGAFYQEPNGGYTNSMDATMIATLKVSSTMPVDLSFYNSSSSGLVEISSTGWYVPGPYGASGIFSDSNAFHTVEIQTFAATNTYAFSVDGVVLATGNSIGYSGGPQVYFGDGASTGGGTVIGDFESVTYYQGSNPYALPEPSGLMMMAVSIPIFVLWQFRAARRLRPVV